MVKIICHLMVLLISVLTSALFAQEVASEKISITGTVQRDNEQAMADAIVTLQDAVSHSIVKTELTTEKGSFTFADIPTGNYRIDVNKNNTKQYSGDAFLANKNLDLGTIIAKNETKTLDEVAIVKTKPYIERQQGKMILNMESSIGSTGSSAFEVLEKAPGVNIDDNDNISLRGKGGVLVQIDGKITPMTGTNLGNYLRGLPSGSIDKIEFITNPSSKYDASGSAIINIRLKKDKRSGTNGSLAVAYGQGKYGKNNNNLSLNHKKGKMALFGNYSYAYREGFTNLILKRSFYEDGIFKSAYNQNNYLKMDFKNHIARVGMDYFANDKNILGFSISKVSNKFNPKGDNVSDVYDENNMLSSRFTTTNRSHDHWKNFSANLNHKYTIDTLGTELSSDFDYAHFGNDTKQNFNTRYLNLDNTEFQNPYLLHGDIHGGLDIYSLKSDFSTTLKNKTKLDTGAKTSYVKAANNLVFYDHSNGGNVYDPSKSNHFIYKENINAVYANASKEFGKWSTQLGLRMENTNITGEQLVTQTEFKNNYTQLFPSAFLGYTINDKNSLELNYSRRITRPSYDQLNPFKFFLDPTTYKEGNPYLEPQTAHSLELTHVFKQKIFTTLNYSRTNNNITEVIAPSETDQQVTIQTNKNLDAFDLYGLFVVMPLEINKWWSTSNSLNFYYGSYSGTIANTTITNAGNFTYNFNAVNNFKMANGFTAELTGNYRAKEIYAFENVKPVWFINMGFQKKFKNKSSLKLAINDVFYSNKVTADTQFTGYKETFKVMRDTRVAVLTYTYNFGNSNAISRRKTGGADELKQRAGGTSNS